ncbi:MAG: 16S rRNA (guanine(527)-N(7))-methyltransferase RsmG [Anaerolineales bacterium]
MLQKLAQEALQLFGIRLNSRQLSALEMYQSELVAWNAVHNLTAIDNPEQIRTKHFLDSISCLLAMRGSRCERLIDVGTGAGFPGLVLKILSPQVQVTLVDSVAKKTAFCQHLVAALGLEGVTVLQARAEDLGQNAAHREQYDWAVARAVAQLPILAEYLLPLVRVGGGMLAQKGETAHREAHAAEVALRLLGGHLQQILPVTLPEVADERYLVVVNKIAATPPAYPRRAGVPGKKPLGD